MEIKNKNIKIIFVGGAGRSGTTLVQKILLSHNKISGGPELGITKPIFDLYSSIKIGIDKGSLYNYTTYNRLKDLFKNLFLSFFENYIFDDIIYISEKTPSNIFVSDELLEVFEDAFFINVYRDGRAVLASHLKVKKRAKNKNTFIPISLISTCKLWNKSISHYINLKEGKNAEKLISIKYEELITKPKDTLVVLFKKLGLTIDKTMLNPEKIKFNNNKYDAHINDIWYTKEMYNQSYNIENISKWKKELNIIQIFIASSLMAINMNKMGYDINPFYVKINKFILLFSKERVREKLKNSILLYVYRKVKY